MLGKGIYTGTVVTLTLTGATKRKEQNQIFRYEFIARNKKSKTVTIRYWKKEGQGKGKEITRTEAIKIYKELIKTGYRITSTRNLFN